MAAARKTTARKTTTASKTRRRPSATRNRNAEKLTGFFVPVFFIVGILFCLGFLSLMGYRTVTASSFFDCKKIEVRGNNRVNEEEIEKIVRAETTKSGVWNADLNEIKADVEKLTFVKTAVVSRLLPDGLRVTVSERIPRVVVQSAAGDFWTDEDAMPLGAVQKNDARPPFVLRGWDEAKNDKAVKDNLERVKIYVKMLDDWQTYDLAKRVSAVNLADLQDPQAIIQDSGNTVVISLGKDNFGKRLQKALEVVANKGNQIESVISNGQNVIVKYRNG